VGRKETEESKEKKGKLNELSFTFVCTKEEEKHSTFRLQSKWGGGQIAIRTKTGRKGEFRQALAVCDAKLLSEGGSAVYLQRWDKGDSVNTEKKAKGGYIHILLVHLVATKKKEGEKAYAHLY